MISSHAKGAEQTYYHRYCAIGKSVKGYPTILRRCRRRLAFVFDVVVVAVVGTSLKGSSEIFLRHTT
jgi:hypothetical protein